MTNPAEFFTQEAALLEPAQVTYIVQVGEQVVVVENVPAHINKLTGEQLFSAETAERLLQIAQGRVAAPIRYAEAPVYSFAA